MDRNTKHKMTVGDLKAELESKPNGYLVLLNDDDFLTSVEWIETDFGPTLVLWGHEHED